MGIDQEDEDDSDEDDSDVIDRKIWTSMPCGIRLNFRLYVTIVQGK